MEWGWLLHVRVRCFLSLNWQNHLLSLPSAHYLISRQPKQRLLPRSWTEQKKPGLQLLWPCLIMPPLEPMASYTMRENFFYIIKPRGCPLLPKNPGKQCSTSTVQSINRRDPSPGSNLDPIDRRLGKRGTDSYSHGNNTHFSEGDPWRRANILEILALHGSLQ